MVPPERPGTQTNVFWLSSRGEKRESDATLLYGHGKAVRFDIGFIGPGNPEISLDKVTRFERALELSGEGYAVETIIIVDRIGRGSRIEDLARRVNGYIVQMSAAYWPKAVARILQATIGFQHPLATIPDSEVEAFLRTQLASAPLEEFIRYTEMVDPSELNQPPEGE